MLMLALSIQALAQLDLSRGRAADGELDFKEFQQGLLNRDSQLFALLYGSSSDNGSNHDSATDKPEQTGTATAMGPREGGAIAPARTIEVGLVVLLVRHIARRNPQKTMSTRRQKEWLV